MVPCKITKPKLQQNYPNAFEEITTIPYSLTNTSRVKLIVYDNTKKPLETLVDTIQVPGDYKVEFNATGYCSNIGLYHISQSEDMEIYFYRLVTEQGSSMKKMLRQGN